MPGPRMRVLGRVADAKFDRFRRTHYLRAEAPRSDACAHSSGKLGVANQDHAGCPRRATPEGAGHVDALDEGVGEAQRAAPLMKREMPVTSQPSNTPRLKPLFAIPAELFGRS